MEVKRGNLNHLQALEALLYEQGMGISGPPDDYHIIEDGKGEVLACLKLVADGTGAYMEVIAVRSDQQKQGLGTQLLSWAGERYPKISVLARGEAVPFYTRAGFHRASFAVLPPEYQQQCESCEEKEQCQPAAMLYTRPSHK